MLVVDDEPSFRDLVTRLLEKGGLCECRAVESGFEVARALREFKPHLVLLDVVLPGADGFAICRVIKSDPATAHIPVALMSGLVPDEMRARYRAVGASAMLVKPFPPGDLFQFVVEHAGAASGGPEAVVDDVDLDEGGFLTRLASVQVDEISSARRALERDAAPAPGAPDRLSVGEITRLMADLDPSLAAGLPAFAEPEDVSRLRIAAAPDRMSATLVLPGGSGHGRVPSKEEVLRRLADLGVVAGIDEAAIDTLLELRGRSGRKVEGVVARGVPPSHGRDTRIEPRVSLQRERSAAAGLSRAAESRERVVLPFIRAGEVVAEIVPHVAGKDGYDVFGKSLPAEPGAQRQVRVGKGAILSDDGREIYARISGFVHIDGYLVDVRDCYVHEGDVGIVSGNLVFAGDAAVTGSVRAGFEVEVGGNLQIGGAVEAARVKAGGDLLIQGGVTGAVERPARLSCGGRFEALFVENAEVVAGGDVLVTDVVAHSRLYGGDLVEVSGKRGRIIGGEVSARGEVACMEAGAPGGAETLLCAGEDPVARGRLREIERTLAELAGKMKIVQRLVDGMKRRGLTPEILHLMQENPNIRDFLANYGRMREEFVKLAGERSVLAGVCSTRHAAVRVLGAIHPNVRVKIKGAAFLNLDERSNVAFTLGPEGEIVHG